MEFETGNLYFTKIYVIESLSNSDKKTGTELYNDIIVRRLYNDPITTSKLVKIESAKDFYQEIDSIYEEIVQNKILPYLHFETHGSKNGILLSSNEEIEFKVLMAKLRKLNLASKNNLFVSVSACWGGLIQFQIDITKPSPIRGFIGPMDEIYEFDLLSNFSRYFDTLLTTDDFEQAINALNLVSNIEFHHLNAESFYDLIMKMRISNYKSEDEYDQYLLKMTLKDSWKNNPKSRLIYRTKGRFRKAMMKDEVVNIHKIKQQLRNKFLHIN